MQHKQNPTEAEMELLQVLWQHGPCTVSQIHAFLKDNPPRVYTTILKLMQIMAEKGFVTRNEKGRAHVYRAAVSEEQIHRNYLKHILTRVFDNSTGKLVAQALAARPVSPEELADIRRMLDEMEERLK
jgi:BlaI family penicillinase repressor